MALERRAWGVKSQWVQWLSLVGNASPQRPTVPFLLPISLTGIEASRKFQRPILPCVGDAVRAQERWDREGGLQLETFRG